MKRRFWTYYLLSVIVFVLGGVYIATANLDSGPLLLSSAEMQQLVGTYESHAHCDTTDGCSVIACWDSPARIVTRSQTIFRCYDGGSWCEDSAGDEDYWSCTSWGYDSECVNQEWGPTYTYTYDCTDGGGYN